MNVWKIALFIFLLQLGVNLVTVANFPIQCSSNNTQCVYFSVDTLRSTDMGSIISNQIDSGQFESTQINENIFATDAFTFTSTALGIVTNFIYMSIFGIYTFILFVFGVNAVSLIFAGGMQVVVYYFYGRLIVDSFRPGSGGNA